MMGGGGEKKKKEFWEGATKPDPGGRDDKDGR